MWFDAAVKQLLEDITKSLTSLPIDDDELVASLRSQLHAQVLDASFGNDTRKLDVYIIDTPSNRTEAFSSKLCFARDLACVHGF